MMILSPDILAIELEGYEKRIKYACQCIQVLFGDSASFIFYDNIVEVSLDCQPIKTRIPLNYVINSN